jgi:hypothetical protein
LDSRSDRIASAYRLSGPIAKSQWPDASASNAAQCPLRVDAVEKVEN